MTGGCINGSCADCPETCGSCADACGADCCGGMACGGESNGLAGLLGIDRRMGYACDPGAGGCGPLGCLRGRQSYTPGPPSAGVTYPYYTTRGPRDFLAASPRSIGP